MSAEETKAQRRVRLAKARVRRADAAHYATGGEVARALAALGRAERDEMAELWDARNSVSS